MQTLNTAIVDDSRVARQAIRQALEQSGLATFTFLDAADGVEALALLDKNRIDIMFLDWNLPSMNGPDVVRRMRHNRATANIPVVMVTSERSMGKVMQALDESEVDGYICKPFTVDDLRQRLPTILEDIQNGRPRERTRKTKKSGGFFSRLLGRG